MCFFWLYRKTWSLLYTKLVFWVCIFNDGTNVKKLPSSGYSTRWNLVSQSYLRLSLSASSRLRYFMETLWTSTKIVEL